MTLEKQIKQKHEEMLKFKEGITDIFNVVKEICELNSIEG